MPRENKVRQRGKKKQNQQVDHEQQEQQPDWVVSQHEHEHEQQQQQQQQQGEQGERADDFDDSTPFGIVDPEIKNYFKTAHADLVAAANSTPNHEQDQHALLLSAALQELNGHELALATDPDTSLVLEYLIHSINNTQLRVLADRLTGSLFPLATHRFGSHVLEAILAALQRSLASNASSIQIAAATGADVGTLRSAKQLIIDFTAELKQAQKDAVSTLLHHQFGTHILRTLLSILSGRSLDSDANTRSKRSTAFRQKQDVSAFDRKRKSTANPDGTQHDDASSLPVPDEFTPLLHALLADLTEALNINEVRALSHNVVAAPTLGLALALERPPQDGDLPVGRLADLILDNIPSTCADFVSSKGDNKKKKKKRDEDLPRVPERSDHMESSLRDSIASHLIQRALELLAQRALTSPRGSTTQRAAIAAGRLFWRTYFAGRTVNLASHPTANYIVQSGVALLGSSLGPHSDDDGEEDELRSAIAELHSSGKKLVKASMAPLPAPGKRTSGKGAGGGGPSHVKTDNRTGVLHAVLLRAGHLGKPGGYEAEAVRAVLASFGFGEDADADGEQDGDEEGEVKKTKKKDKDQKKKSKKGKSEDAMDEDEDEDEGEGEGDEEQKKQAAASLESEKHAAERKIALVVPCIISMRSRKAYERILSSRQTRSHTTSSGAAPDADADAEGDGDGESLACGLRDSPAHLSGSVILQAILRMEPPASEAIYKSLLHPLNGPSLLRLLSSSAPGMHVLLTALGSSTASFQHRTALFRALLPLLVEITVGEGGKWGSRVADGCWDWADPFFKEKIAAEALRRERTLLSSHFGNFFLKRVHVGLYRREPRSWKDDFVRGLGRKAWIAGLAEEWEGVVVLKEWEAAAAAAAPDAEVNPVATNGSEANGSTGSEKVESKEKKKKKKKRKEKADDEEAGGQEQEKKKRKRSSASDLDKILSMISD
ncbi:hypothetical protein A4X06_0g2404 [Tilletia controversa]|uniref:Nucleolar protein 9 n=1 Tax=Tilletia controversa TaxID=13291 RepID=A0A8X7SYS9_9BASI|nr:hypothetical protein A4X06_0g2404 [Tilletia controversa]